MTGQLPEDGTRFRLPSVDCYYALFCRHEGAPLCLLLGGIVAMLTIIKASLLGSVLIFLGGCASYSTKTSCANQEPNCHCVRYTTINRSWVDCR